MSAAPEQWVERFVGGDTNALTDEELDTYGFGVNYQLAKGVRLNGFAAYVDFDETNVAGDGDIDGFIIGTGVGLSF